MFIFGLLTLVPTKPAPPVEPISTAIREVFVRLRVPFKSAAADMGVPQSNLSRSLNEFGPSVARLAMLPSSVKRQVWYALRPFFGFEEPEPPVIDVADLQRRVVELEDFVRRLQPPVTQPQENRRTA